MQTNREAELICRYLVNKPLSAHAAVLYARASELHPVKLSSGEKKIWKRCLRYPFLIAFVDAALAFQDSASGIRKKLFLMLSVLESLPEYQDDFLPKSRGPFYLIYLLFKGCFAVLKLVTGQILLWIL